MYSDGWHFWTSARVSTLLEERSIFSYLPIGCVFHSCLWDIWKVWLPKGIKSSLFVIIHWESVLCIPWGWVLEGATEDSNLRGLRPGVCWYSELEEAGARKGEQVGRDQAEPGLEEMSWWWCWFQAGLHAELNGVWQTQVLISKGYTVVRGLKSDEYQHC